MTTAHCAATWPKQRQRIINYCERTGVDYIIGLARRPPLAALGYWAIVLIERLRALALVGTTLATAQMDTLRVKLLKLAAVITGNPPAHPPVVGLPLAQCGYLCACDAPVALTLIQPQRMAWLLTQIWPATLAGVGAVASWAGQNRQQVLWRSSNPGPSLWQRGKTQF